jgi:hypothetical protein
VDRYDCLIAATEHRASRLLARILQLESQANPLLLDALHFRLIVLQNYIVKLEHERSTAIRVRRGEFWLEPA